MVRRVRGRDGRARASTCAGLDSVAIATGYGMRARRVEGVDELRQALAEAIASDGAGAGRGHGRPRHVAVVPSVPLLAPDVSRIAPAAAAPAPDRVPDALAAGTPEPLRSELVALLGADRVLARVSDLVRYASDASPYRLIPRAVVMAHDARDVAR